MYSVLSFSFSWWNYNITIACVCVLTVGSSLYRALSGRVVTELFSFDAEFNAEFACVVYVTGTMRIIGVKLVLSGEKFWPEIDNSVQCLLQT